MVAVMVIGLGMGFGPHLISPGMPYSLVCALAREKPVLLNIRANNTVRAVQLPRAGITVEFDEGGRVLKPTRKDEVLTSEKELARVAAALPAGTKRGERPVLLAGQVPTEEEKLFGYARLRVARMTSDTTAKITVSFYCVRQGKEYEGDTLFLYLSYYKGWWTVTKTEGGGWTGPELAKLIAYLDEVSGNPDKKQAENGR